MFEGARWGHPFIHRLCTYRRPELALRAWSCSRKHARGRSFLVLGMVAGMIWERVWVPRSLAFVLLGIVTWAQERMVKQRDYRTASAGEATAIHKLLLAFSIQNNSGLPQGPAERIAARLSTRCADWYPQLYPSLR